MVPYPGDLVYGQQAEAATGVPLAIIRKWASRGRIRRYPGGGRPDGRGHLARTMYSLPEIQALAHTYRPNPGRAPVRRPGRGARDGQLRATPHAA